MPRVSIVIPAYNASETILEALDSARSQTLEEIEILVIDDASTDSTAAIVLARAADDPRIQLHRLASNSGPAAARNAGLAKATGEWIALLDADDSFSPERLERLLEMSAGGEVLVADNLNLYDRHAQKIVSLGIRPDLLGTGMRLDGREFVDRCKTNQPGAVDFGLLKPLIRTAHIRAYGLSYDVSMRYGEDFQFYLDVLLAGGTMLVLPEAHYQYTERVGTISKTASGVSKTIARHSHLERHTRALAQDPKYSKVAPQLIQRADALRKLAKINSFGQRSRFAKLAALPVALADPQMREYFRSRIHARFSRLAKSTLIRDSSHLCLGQGLKLLLQGIYFLCIVRSLGPAQYGAFVAVTAMTSILAPYVGLGCGNLFLRNVRAGRRDAQMSWGNGLFTTFVTGVFTTLVLCGLARLWSPSVPASLILAVCLSDLLLARVIELASFGFAASGKMGKTAVQNTTMSVLRVIGIVVLILCTPNVTVASWAWVYLITALIGCCFAFQQGNALWGRPRVSLRAIYQDIREGSFFSISTSAQTIYNDIDKTMLARLSTLSATGVYAAAYRIIDTSLTPVRSLVSAAYPEFFRIGKEGIDATYGYAMRLIRKAVLFGTGDFVALIVIAPLLPHILGAKYEGVAPAIRLLALIPVMRCVHWFLADALSGADAQGLRTAIQVGVALFNIGLNIVILPRWSWVGAAWTSLASDAALMVAVYLAVQWKRPAQPMRNVVHATE